MGIGGAGIWKGTGLERRIKSPEVGEGAKDETTRQGPEGRG